MSKTYTPAAAPTARQARMIAKKFAAQLTGRAERGPDPRVHRHSVDVDHPDAKPWAPIGDGSFAQGIVHREALMQAAKELRRQQWEELPNAAVREARQRRGGLAAELEQLASMQGTAAIGRPALIRQELAQLDALLARSVKRMQRVDLAVLEAILHHLDFRTGRMFPSLERIAAVAVCHRNSAIAALRRLKAHGLIDWVRRSVKADTAGQWGPQREQTSNAYFFDHRRHMAGRVFQRYWQLLVAKLRRLGAVPTALAPNTPHATEPAGVADEGLCAALASMAATVANAST